ncbi:MAG: glycosyltransferase [Ramlibacter sp.]|nr:glycosyltransferase [Ramlibacter sp.]
MSRVSISGFSFIRNGVMLGFPFVESIRSLLPLVDEFVIAVGRSDDDTLEQVRAIADPKIRIIETVWNEGMADRGFVYAQQKMIAQYACTGDWAFYLEGDEVVHERELAAIRASVDQHHGNPAVEALVFDYVHFYGTPQYVSIGPGWYRRECRLVRNTIRTYAPDGQYWLVMDRHKRPRNPHAALANAHIFHYGWVRKAEQMQAKLDQVAKYWAGSTVPKIDYANFDSRAVKPFQGTHPEAMALWIATQAEQQIAFNPHYQLTPKERKYRLSMKLEKLTGLDFSRKHFKLVA